MPIKLASLELNGYKTFAQKTTFDFPARITAIVGPNGSGKSNVADAIRWVLGEQSYSLLRAKKTEDMIYNGSDQRARAGMASVSITLIMKIIGCQLSIAKWYSPGGLIEMERTNICSITSAFD